MRQKLLIFTVFGLLLAILAGLNAATYVQKRKTPDTEVSANRSTFNSGATGTRAYFALLSETGRSVTRWQTPVAELSAAGRNRPDTFVLISPRQSLDDLEQSQIKNWVASGGRLVLIDRDPPDNLLISDPWSLRVDEAGKAGILSLDPADVKAMTTGAVTAKPVQPTELTASVNAIQPSRLASSIDFVRKSYESEVHADEPDTSDAERYDFYRPPPAPAPKKMQTAAEPQPALNPPQPALSVGGPVVHVASESQNIVVSVPYGAGEIVLVSDPYLVSNAGIGLVDNAALAVNLVSGRPGPIAFDEYHQGYGNNNNQFIRYFDGTPVIAIAIQLAALIALILFSQSRRFARPVPESEIDRLSKLEYISAMAELQQRTAAYDLAIENIYGEFRRRVSRLVGTENKTVKRSQLAALIGERAKMSALEIDELMAKCEDIIQGEPTGRATALEIIRRLRSIEAALGIVRSVQRAKI